MITIADISIKFGERTILANLNWSINEGSRIGLVGDNGAGKTTLLKALTGIQQLDKGTISIPKILKTGYLPQDLVELQDSTLIDFIREETGIAKLEKEITELETAVEHSARGSGEYKSLLNQLENKRKIYENRDGYSFDAMAKKVLKGLGFSEDDSNRKCSDFSGGWKMRILLASVLLSEPDILLLDEPTNHLDTESMEWLEGWLSSFPGTIIAISHDRRFLDKICRQIAEVYRGTITLFKGNLSQYQTVKEKNRELQERALKKQHKEIEKTEAFISRFRYKASKASQVQSRIRKLEKMEVVNTIEKGISVHLRFPPCERSGYEVVKLDNVSQAYDGKQVFSGINFSVTRGQKIALVGVNGAGKSTLSRLLGNEEPPFLGKVIHGHKVKIGFFSQESSKNLNYENSIWQEIAPIGSLNEQEKKGLLGSFLFSGDDIHKPISVLSGGEKSRLALLKILLEDFNFLILDEPTNHLDMKTRELFQQALLSYDGTLIIVSHDRYFLDELVERVIEIRNGKLFDYPGNYSYFIEKRTASLTGPMGNGYIGNVESEKQKNNSDPRQKKREEAEKRNHLFQIRKKIMIRLKPVEERISSLENERSGLDERLCCSEHLQNSGKVQEILKRRSEIENELESLILEWENLMMELEAVSETV